MLYLIISPQSGSKSTQIKIFLHLYIIKISNGLCWKLLGLNWIYGFNRDSPNLFIANTFGWLH